MSDVRDSDCAGERPARRIPAGHGRGDSPGARALFNNRGFTLLEVIVALAILSLAVVAAIQGFAQGLRLLKLSGEHQHAMQIADEKAREVVELKEGNDQGTEGDFRWERTIRTLEAPELALIGAPRWRVWEIDVRVSWEAQRQVQIATLRTVPTADNPLPPGRSPGR